MIFSSLSFLYLFMPLLLVTYYLVRNEAYRRAVLLVFSLVFYAWGEPVYILLLVAVALVDYLLGRGIGKRLGKDGKQKNAKGLLVLAVLVNIGVLAVFKYTNFFCENINDVLSALYKAAEVPDVWRMRLPEPEPIMPIGISFFSFQALSYVIDVYRGDAKVQRSYPKLLLYIMLFPQLIAGPIVRYKDVAEQLDNRRITVAGINEGLYRFAVGLGKKVIIANNCGAVFARLIELKEVTVLGSWGIALFFTVQLYFDFSGYSDMAIGLGRMFGFRFLENFNYPFLSGTATEFWRRWHMSLGTFFRDYVYIPLGGNRRWHLRNIFVVWFLTGFWHGADWNFIIWGLYYGVLLVIEKFVFMPIGKKLPKHWAMRTLTFFVSRAYFIFITLFGFSVFAFTEEQFGWRFDAGLLKNLGYLFGVGTTGLTELNTNSIFLQNIILLAVAVVLSLPIVPILERTVRAFIPKNGAYATLRIAKTAVILALVGISTALLVGNSYNPFLYFRF